MCEGLKTLFIPSETYFSGKNDNLKALINGKMNVDKYLNIANSLTRITSNVPDNITCELYGMELTIVDWQFVIQALPTFHYLVKGLVFIFLLFYNYNQIIWLIRGTKPISDSVFNGGEKK